MREVRADKDGVTLDEDDDEGPPEFRSWVPPRIFGEATLRPVNS